MLSQYDSYPSVGYQQQTYEVCQEGWYPPSTGYKTGVPGMHLSPSITGPPPSNPYMMAEGRQEGMWSSPNKHHTEWDGKSHGHNKHSYNTGYGGYAQPHDKHHNGWSGKPEHYSHGYNSHGGMTGHGYGPAMQPVGYMGGEDPCPRRPHESYEKVEEYWAVKDIKD